MHPGTGDIIFDVTSARCTVIIVHINVVQIKSLSLTLGGVRTHDL